MAANDFEKNVQRVMGDFKLQPSDEVWQKVEERISNNRRKRRTLFFIIFAFMSLAIGGYGIYHFSDTAHTRSKLMVENKTLGTGLRHQGASPSQVPSFKEDTHVEDIALRRQAVNKDVRIAKTASSKNPVAGARVTEKQENKKTTTFQNNAAVVFKGEDVKLTTKSTVKEDEQVDGNVDSHEKAVTKHLSLAEDQLGSIKSERENMTGASTNEKIASNVLNDTLNNSKVATSTPKSERQNQSFKKWRWGLHLSLGASTLTQDPLSFNGMSNTYANAYSVPSSSTGGAPSATYSSSPNKPAFAFKTGLMVERQISRRSIFSAGLSYAYLADKIKVGQNSTQLTSAYRSAFYTAAPQHTYTDRFHFVELPILYQWKMTKSDHHYLSASGGASASYLLTSNALVYDTALHGVYYEAGSLLKRTHFSFLTGMSYHFAKATGFELATGPQFSFDVTKLTQSEVDQRKYFLYIGVDTRVKFDRLKKK